MAAAPPSACAPTPSGPLSVSISRATCRTTESSRRIQFRIVSRHRGQRAHVLHGHHDDVLLPERLGVVEGQHPFVFMHDAKQGGLRDGDVAVDTTGDHASARPDGMRQQRASTSNLRRACWTSAVDGPDLNATALPDYRISRRRGEGSCEV